MSEDKFRSEMSYLAALSIAKNLREKGLLSEEEYAVIDTIGKRLDIIGFQSDI